MKHYHITVSYIYMYIFILENQHLVVRSISFTLVSSASGRDPIHILE